MTRRHTGISSVNEINQKMIIVLFFLNAQLNVWLEVTLQPDWNRAALARKGRTRPSTRSETASLARQVRPHGAEAPVGWTTASPSVREGSFPRPVWPPVSLARSDSTSHSTVRDSASAARDGRLTQPESEPSTGWNV